MNIWHLTQRKERPMSSITVGRENTDDIDIYYEDHGTGHPIALIPRIPSEWTNLTAIDVDHMECPRSAMTGPCSWSQCPPDDQSQWDRSRAARRIIG
jgi:hypothetical protein